MVSLVIGLVVSLAVYGVMTTSEGRKRTTTSKNDIDLAGAYALYQIDKAVRSAGSGLGGGIGNTQAAGYSFGCKIKAAKSGTQKLPATAAFPTPFANASTTVRLVPVVIMDGQAPGATASTDDDSDILQVMSGSGGLAETGTRLSGKPTVATNVTLDNLAGFRANDLALFVESGKDCLVEQVANSFPTTNAAILALVGNLPLGGTFAPSAAVAGTGTTTYSSSSLALNLGQTPAFNMFAVGANNNLFRYDLLQSTNDSIVDGVYQIHAIYGVYASAAHKTSHTITWQAPTGSHVYSTLLNGSAASNGLLQNIVALKIGVVMRTSLPDKDTVSTSTLTLFSDTPIPVTVTLSDTSYRYQVFETTIPLRNALML